MANVAPEDIRHDFSPEVNDDIAALRRRSMVTLVMAVWHLVGQV